ncbi:unnamed protein product [Peronospora destructor]|uniref:C2 domain-containing protein n=1 Tax=Peronospora destructor TaxID=86335 RepID=A0AAV0VAW9_9STRA|nr:unnamed protein product [Peronospora destructor]
MFTAAVPLPQPVRLPTSSVELSLSAKDLKDRDIISKADPLGVLYVKKPHSPSFLNTSGASWTKLGKTEAKKDNLNPTWTKLFIVEFHFESVQQLKVEVYDQDSSSPVKLKEQDFIGKAEFTLGQLMGPPGQSGSFVLTRGKPTEKHQGSLLVKAEEVKTSSEVARLRFSATGLANMDGMFSKSDPFLVISRLREDGSYTQVHTTETIDNNLNPNWKRFELPLQHLCNGDYERPLSLQVFDEDRGGKSELIGQAQTTLEEIRGKQGPSFVLHNEALQKKKGKKYTNAGLLVAAEAEIYREHTFIDYLRGGLEMSLIIGIDYTASNGPPHDRRSLHFLDPRGPNHKLPVYGFGGIPPGDYDVDHCFPLNLNPSNPEVAGSHGVLELYTSSLGHIGLHKPTFFAPLIHQSLRIAGQLGDPHKQKYFVLLIITDGAIMDMQKTIDALVVASHLSPLSIVIIGVDPADFSSMVALDGDGGKLRASNGHRVCTRYSLCKHNSSILRKVPPTNNTHRQGTPLKQDINKEVIVRSKVIPLKNLLTKVTHPKATPSKATPLKDLPRDIRIKEGILFKATPLTATRPKGRYKDISKEVTFPNRAILPRALPVEQLQDIQATVAD